MSKRAPHTDDDLTWLFRWSAGAVGLRSSASPGPGGGSVCIEDRLADERLTELPGRGRDIAAGVARDATTRRKVGEPAITRLRRLEAALHTLSTEDQRTLWLAYGPHPLPPPQHSNALGPWPALTQATAIVQGAYQAHLAAAQAEHDRRATSARQRRQQGAQDAVEWARAVAAQCRPTAGAQRVLKGGVEVMAPDSLVDVPGGLVPTVRPLLEWLCQGGQRGVLRAGVQEAAATLGEAHARWVVAVGRKPRTPPVRGDVPYERVAEPTDWMER